VKYRSVFQQLPFVGLDADQLGADRHQLTPFQVLQQHAPGICLLQRLGPARFATCRHRGFTRTETGMNLKPMRFFYPASKGMKPQA
jgi:hypothetical protein